MEDKEEEEQREREQLEEIQRIDLELDREQMTWEQDKTRIKDSERRSMVGKLPLRKGSMESSGRTGGAAQGEP